MSENFLINSLVSIQSQILTRIINSIENEFCKKATYLIGRPITSLLWGQGWKTPVCEVISSSPTASNSQGIQITQHSNKKWGSTSLIHYVLPNTVFQQLWDKGHQCAMYESRIKQKSNVTKKMNNLNKVDILTREASLAFVLKRGLHEDIADAISLAVHADPFKLKQWLEVLMESESIIHLGEILTTAHSSFELVQLLQSYGYTFTTELVKSCLELGEWWVWS